MGRRAFVGLLAALVLVLAAAPAGAYMCPVLIQRAQETIAKAERGRMTAESRSLLDEARQLLDEARAAHEHARSKKDHDDAIRKARTAQGLAEEALKLETP